MKDQTRFVISQSLEYKIATLFCSDPDSRVLITKLSQDSEADLLG